MIERFTKRSTEIRPVCPRINDMMRAIVAEVAEEGVADPIGEQFTLAFVWADLCRLSGEALPPEVLAALDEPTIVCALLGA